MEATQIQPSMYVIGSDGECVGTVSQIEGRKIKFSDPSVPGGRFCSIDVELAHSVASDRVILLLTSTEIMNSVHQATSLERK